MLLGTLAFLLGICHVFFMTEIPITLITCLAIVALLLCLCRCKFSLPLILIVGCLLPHLYQHVLLPQQLEPYFYQPVFIKAEVIDFPKRDAIKQKLLLRVLQINDQPVQWFKPKVTISWYDLTKQPQLGEVWSLKVRFKPPRGLANQYGFDYERWLKAQNILALGSVLSSDENRLLKSTSVFSIHFLRRHVREQLQAASVEYKHYLEALVLGIKTGIPNVDKNQFADTGTAHLFAISGLHIGIIALASFWFCSRLLLCIPQARHRALTAGTIGACVASGVYAGLAGFSLPTVRALLMVSLFAANHLLSINLSRFSVFCLTLCIILLIDPLQILAAGFWLSFGAVFLILVLLNKKSATWLNLLLSQFRLSIAMLPLNVLIFKKVIFLAPLYNFILIPIFSSFLVPLAFVITLLLLVGSPVETLGSLFDWGIGTVVSVLSTLNNYFSWQWPVNEFALVALIILLAVIFCLPKVVPKKSLTAFAIVFCLYCYFHADPPERLRITVFDVGHGLAILLEEGDSTLLFDTGFGYASGFNAAEAVVLPHLRAVGIKAISDLVLSHNDNDHIGGAKAVLAGVAVDRIWSGQALAFTTQAQDCHQGQSWHWQHTQFQFLKARPEKASKNNDYSCVLRVQFAEHTILLTGDIEKKSEQNILSNYKDLKADTLVIPHHGSATSSSDRFVRAVQAKRGIFSVGYKNRYRLPNDEVLRRYQQNGTKILRTDQHGQIVLTLSKGDISIVTERQSRRRFWRYNDPSQKNENSIEG